MADYATIDDVFKRYPLISNLVGSGSNLVASADVASVYISDGASVVDAFLRAKYITPLVVEPMVTWITSDIAIYRMFEDKLPRFPDAVEKRYTNAMSMLMLLQLGKLTLTSSQIVGDGGDQDAWSNAQSYSGPIFRAAEEVTNCGSLDDPFFVLGRGAD
jgi:phage gp36-like protein